MTETILQRIVATKTEEVAAAKQEQPEAKLRQEAEKRRDRRLFGEGLRRAHQSATTAIIAEIKRASPSKGIIREDLDVAVCARQYEQGRAAALSVLTDRTYFRGSPEDLRQARQNTVLPVLRKDFLVDAYQLYESATLGADAVLLIARILAPAQLTDYLQLCRELDLEALVEIHDEADLDIAGQAGAELIGINNRDLTTFRTDPSVAIRMVSQFSPDQTPVAASGIKTATDIRNTRQAGIYNFLIGESLVRAGDTVKFLQQLLSAEEEP